MAGAAALLCSFLLVPSSFSQVPPLLNYQGRVAVGAANFDGSGQFKFALVNEDGSKTYWSNDGSSKSGSEPDKAVTLTVSKGLYSVLLGDKSLANMSVIPAGVFSNPDIRLRVWFDDGPNGSQRLVPDQRLAPAVYLAAGTVTSSSIANGAVGSAQLGSGLTLPGNTTGTFSGNVTGNLTGNVSGNVSGTASSFTGYLDGEVTGAQGSTFVFGATSTNVIGAIVRRDLSGNFAAGTITAGALSLPATTSASVGVIKQNGGELLHSFGTDNFFAGKFAGNFTMTGFDNTASGPLALTSNTTGYANTASGKFALYSNTTGNSNTAVGRSALVFNDTGTANTASGGYALYSNTTGSYNTAVGFGADVSTGALTNATAIGYQAIAAASNMVRLGNSAVTLIQGQVAFTASSDRHLKENFRPVDGAEVLRKLRGFDLTSWNYIGHDPKTFRHYGPMAQDFFAAFGHDEVGTIGTDTTINSGDIAGILMCAAKELAVENEALKKQLAERDVRDAERDVRDAERDARLARLEQMILSPTDPRQVSLAARKDTEAGSVISDQ